MLRVIVALVAGVLIGLAIGFLAFQDSGTAEGAVDVGGAPRESSRSTERGAPDGPSPLAAAPSRRIEKEEEDAPLPEETTRAIDTVREVAKADDEATRGDGVIKGTIVDVDGNPLSGVTVRASRRRESDRGGQDSTRGGVPKERSLDETLRDQARDLLTDRAGRREAVSDGAGAYSVGGLADGRYDMAAFANGYVLRARNGATRDVEPGSVVNFRALPLNEVPAEVLLPDGRRAVRATLLVSGRPNEGIDVRNWSAEDATLWLSEGTYRVRAVVAKKSFTANGVGQELASEQIDVTVERGKAHEPVVFQLTGRRGIRGRVVIPDDEAGDNYIVHRIPAPARGEVDLQALARSNDDTQWVGSWSPHFEMLDIKAGKWAVGVARDWNSPIAASAVVEVHDRIESVVLELKPLATKDSLLVRTRDPNGAPVRHIQFMLRSDSNIDWLTSSDELKEQKPGEYLLPPNEKLAKWMAGGDAPQSKEDVFLVGQSDENGSAETRLVAGQREVTLTFSATAWLELTIANYAGSGLEGRIDANLRADQRASFYSGRGNNGEIQPDGTAKLGPVNAGKMTLNVSVRSTHPQGFMTSSTVLRQQVELVSGTNRLTVTLPPVYPLVVRVGGDAQARASVSRIGGQENSGARVEGGVARFDALVAGDYLLNVSGLGAGKDGTMRVRVPGGAEVTFVPEAQNALRVRITDTNGALARRGFVDGDIVVGIDGVEFTDEAGMRQRYYGAFDRDSVKLLVLRGDKRVEIEVNGKELANGQALGGSLNPGGK